VDVTATDRADLIDRLGRLFLALVVLIGCFLLMTDADPANDDIAKIAATAVITYFFVDAARNGQAAITERVLRAQRPDLAPRPNDAPRP
jgi:hypothetical protein